MKKKLLKILPIIMLLIVISMVFVPQTANASLEGALGCILYPPGCIVSTAASAVGIKSPNLFLEAFTALGNLILGICSYLLTLAGVILNIAIVLTMNIKAIYLSTPAIEQMWIVIRNISSIFIIFGLLYASISTILGVGKNDLKSWVANIIIAGVLINFSLFFAKILIDASNLASLQIYRAIAPTAQNINLTNSDSISSLIGNSFQSGGSISDIFMQSLKIPSIWNNKSGLITADSDKTLLNILVSTVYGSVLIIIAAASMFAAALAFIARLVILLLLMAVSPIYFVGIIFPQVKREISDKLMGYFKNQLIFMPAYLLFMYVAMSFISSDTGKGFFAALDSGRLAASGGVAAAGGSNVLFSTVGLLLQYAIALILINLPLIAAFKLGAIGPKWASGIKDWAGGFSKKMGSAVGRNTLGRAGRRVGGAFDSMAANIESRQDGLGTVGRGASVVLRNLGISQAVRGGISNVEKGKYGRQSLEEIEKEDKDRARVISGVQRTKTHMDNISKVVGPKSTTHAFVSTEMDSFRKSVAGMDNKELEKLDIKTLTDPKFASALPSSKYDALMKSTELSPAEQSKLKDAREQGFKDILNGGPDGANNILSGLLKSKAEEIAKLPADILIDPRVALKLDSASLRKMIDTVGKDKRDLIRSIIETTYAAATTPGGPPLPGTTAANLSKVYDYLQTPQGQIF